jgi:hypothetical protein
MHLHNRRKPVAVAAAVLAIFSAVMVGSMATATAATLGTITRAPYVTDLTPTSAYVNFAVKGSSTAGSVIVQPDTGTCPSSIPWSSKAIKSPTSIPLDEGSATTASWKITVVSTTEYQESVPVPNLTADSAYCYAVYPTDSSSSTAQLWPTQSFTTLQAPSTSTSSTPVTFDVIADTGEDTSGFNQGESNIYKEIGGSGAQFLLMAGDVSYTGGTETSYGDLDQTAANTDESNIFGPQYFPLANGIPTYVADGNHGQTVDDLRIWPTPKTVAASGGTYAFNPPTTSVDGVGTTTKYPQDWYAIQDGDVRIYMLDASWEDSTSYLAGTTATGSKCGAAGSTQASYCEGYQIDADEHWQTTSPEYKWLAADLAAHPGGIKMAVWHYPLRSVNETQPSDPYLSGVESLLAKNGVQVAFNGHAHTYQDIQPTAAGTVANFVTGGGGGTLEPVDPNGDNGANAICTPMLAIAKVFALGWTPSASSNPGSSCSTGKVATTPTSALDVFNYLKVTVTGSVVSVTAYNALNQPFDSASFTYSGSSPPPPTPPATPTGLAGSGVSTSQVNLTWNSSTGATGYDIYRNGAKVGADLTGTSFQDTGLSPGTTYDYTVDAYDTAGSSAQSTPAVPISTQASTSPPPGSPTLVQTATSTSAGLTVSPTQSGDLLVLSASLYTGASNNITAVADSAGDTWTKLKAVDTSGHNSDGELWYTFTKGSATSVEVTTKATGEAFEVQEFSGVGGIDTQSAFASGTGTSASSGSATPSATGDLAVGFVAGHASTQAITTSAGYTAAPQVNGTNATLATGYQVTGAGALTFGGTFTATMYWAAGLALFTPAG